MLDKEVIELLKTIAGSAETLVIWYFVVGLLKTLIEGATWVFCFYLFGCGAGKVFKILSDL